MVRNTLKQFSNMMVEAKRIERLIKKRKIQDVKIPSTFTEEKETDMNLHVNIIHKHGSQPWLHHLNFSTKPFSIPQNTIFYPKNQSSPLAYFRLSTALLKTHKVQVIKGNIVNNLVF
jgi:hypothetical protein